jgi:hypothetical protein
MSPLRGWSGVAFRAAVLPEIASDARFSLAGKDQSNWKKLHGSVF